MDVQSITQEDLSPKSLLENLKSEDSKLKAVSVRNITIVATELGQERTRKELIPYLINCIDIEEDEVLTEFARIMGNFLDYIGGKSYAKDLIPAFELIFKADDSTIRKEGVKSFRLFLSQISFSDIESSVIDLIKRINIGEESYQKTSCLDLIGLAFRSFTEKNKSETLAICNSLLSHSDAMVRTELAFVFKDIAPYVTLESYQTFMGSFVLDDNDAIRIQIMESIISLQCLNKNSISGYMTYLNQLLKKLVSDESWRVRLTIGDKLGYFVALPSLSTEVKATLIDIFSKLLEDQEAEVRNICCLKLEVITEALCKEPTFDRILTKLKLIEKDTTSYVRTALASTLLRICTLIGTNKTNEFIFPLFLSMMKDENHDIRMTLIKTLDQLHEVVNIDNFIQGIIPQFNEISMNKNWRIRIQVSETIPVLARILSKKLFLESIFSSCIAWLTDPVFAIREAACKLMKKLYDIFKGEDFDKKLLDKMNEMRMNDSYLIRNTTLFIIKEFLTDEFNQDFVERKLTPFVFKLCKDKTPNIRMNCAVILKKLKCKSRDVNREIQSNLEEMKIDKDIDVIYALADN